MVHPISCIVIKSDRLPRKIPVVGEVVRVAEKGGLFVVVSADRERRIAQLIEKNAKHQMLEVPFSSMGALSSNLDYTIRRFLDATDNIKHEEKTPDPDAQRCHSLQNRNPSQATVLRAVDSELTMSCLFCRIIDGSISSNAVYQDDKCYAFADIKPVAPVHILVVPREHIASTADAEKDHKELLGHLLWVAAEIARTKGLAQGYRTVINTGDHGGQTVDHIHIHLLGGRPMTWPPG